MLSHFSHLLAGKRQSRALLQAVVVVTIFLGYFFFSRDIYWYPGKDRTGGSGSNAVEGEQSKGDGKTSQMAGIRPEGVHGSGILGSHKGNHGQSTTTVIVDETATTMVTKAKTQPHPPTGTISNPHPAGEIASTLPSKVPEEIAHPKPSLPTQPPNTTLLAQAPKYIKAILDPFDTSFDRLSCPGSVDIWERYKHLRTPPRTSYKSSLAFGFKPAHEAPGPLKPKYFFALDLYKIAHLLPRLMNSIIEAIKFLGPENCVLSIVEGRSDDGTYEILLSLAPELQKLGIRYIFQTSDLNPKGGERDRIDALAELRNLALRDLIEHPEGYSKDTTVVFSNDVSLCVEDVLELVHQRFVQKADMVCGMDWNLWQPEVFYDSWVGRGMNGDLFIKILRGADSMVDTNLGIFWNHELSRKRFDEWKPVQVFACWNGITAFTARPILEGKIKFRYVKMGDENECYQSEPNLFAKDMWFHGYGKIAVIPTVNLAYSDREAKELREKKGWAVQHVVDDKQSLIEWVKEPPEKVVCVPWLLGDQVWYSWNQGLPGSLKGEKGYKTDEELKIEAELERKQKEKEKAEREKKEKEKEQEIQRMQKEQEQAELERVQKETEKAKEEN